MYPKKPIDIGENFDKETFDDWIKSFDVVLSDCDGKFSNIFVYILKKIDNRL
jgi:hypothetical protein